MADRVVHGILGRKQSQQKRSSIPGVGSAIDKMARTEGHALGPAHAKDRAAVEKGATTIHTDHPFGRERHPRDADPHTGSADQGRPGRTP